MTAPTQFLETVLDVGPSLSHRTMILLQKLMAAFHPMRTLEGLAVQLLQLQPFTLLRDEIVHLASESLGAVDEGATKARRV